MIFVCYCKGRSQVYYLQMNQKMESIYSQAFEVIAIQQDLKFRLEQF